MDGPTATHSIPHLGRQATDRGLRRRWRCRGREPQSTSGNLLDAVLASRGLTNPGDVERFCNPSLSSLHDPSLIPDLDRAAARILDAAKAREPIVIYGDYDVDGTTGSAILVRMLALLEPEAQVSTYIPHRIHEGYGLHTEAIERLAADGVRVVISVDCGITAVAPALTARDAGLDLIITDHHNPPAELSELPDAYAVVHPRRPDSQYPFGGLCGAGAAYKLAWRLATLHAGSDRVPPASRELLLELLGLAALGTVADVVPLIEENRAIVHAGLRRLKFSPFPGVRALVEASGLAGEAIAAEDVGFKLGPRLNAAGRMGHAREALELLISEDTARSRELATLLTRQNDERRALEQRLTADALELAEKSGMTGPDCRAVVLSAPGWHTGVLGIVCSRLVDRLSRPVLLMSQDGDLCAGSGRSIEGFNLHRALESCTDHLDGFGGHDMAAGLRVHTDRFEAFREAFIATANELIRAEDLVRPLDYDCATSLASLTARAVEETSRLAPHGAGNPAVRVRLDGLTLDDSPKSFGKHGDHAGLYVRDASGGRPVRLVGWGWAKDTRHLRRGDPLDAIVEPRLNIWNGQRRIEPNLLDLRLHR
ncbi:MAG: single-stranded-DNA-specific exonuclease RecJ [Planctomycetota bacterium]